MRIIIMQDKFVISKLRLLVKILPCGQFVDFSRMPVVVFIN
jgi:hypothetical protein